ncbi:MAG TPA: alginate export family protein [bacterium]|nr:alginate export family protein [bacterium]
MRNKILKVMAVIFAVALISPSFAAVESVKVGGDITMYGVLRPNFNVGPANEKSQNFFQTSIRVYVTADLTDNVQAMIRLIDEMDWGSDLVGNDTRDILLDLGYIKVTDLMIPGLTLTVGRQEIQFGEGLVVGSAYNGYTYANDSPIAARDLGLQKAFDAIRADYEVATLPITLTVFGAKITEDQTSLFGRVPTGDTGDRNLYGLNIGWRPDICALDVYYVRDDTLHTDQNVDTAGLRVTGEIPAVENLGLKLEYAKQFGEDAAGDDNKGWALLFGADYKFPVNMNPYVKLNYNLFSGNDNDNDNENEGWRMVFPSNIGSRMGQVWYALTSDPNNRGRGIRESNLQAINLGFGLQPVEKVKLALDAYWLKGAEDIVGTEDDIGTEIDLGIEYQYTEDLSFGLSYGMLLTGDLFDTVQFGRDDDNPWQLLATMKLAF